MGGRKFVIVLDGGFGGIQSVRNLDPEKFDVVRIDKVNQHQFQPLFYQVANVAIN